MFGDKMSTFTMHGPVEVEMKVSIINDETNQKAEATVGFKQFEFPSVEEIKRKLATVIPEMEKSGTKGFRLMTKREAFESWCIEKVGQPMALAGGNEWDEI
tara:strand:+ start:448 stop:750 length:303 start_codon:yes stop_codon:yes gene_type:complete